MRGPQDSSASAQHRVVVVGGGFAGYFAARRLGRRAKGAEVALVSDTDAMLYQPLLPGVAAGGIDPRTVAVPLATTLNGVALHRGRATHVDVEHRRLTIRTAAGNEEQVDYDTLVLAVGGVTRLLDIPGLEDHAIGFKTVAEAMFLRDHVLGRLEAANEEADADRRRSLLTFVVVGAGYAGTELTAQMVRLTDRVRPLFPRIREGETHWLLLDMAPAVMPELGQSLGEDALRLLRARGVDVRLKTSVARVDDESVTLTDGSVLGCSTVVWCAGVTANPLIDSLGLPTAKGRLVVKPDLSVEGHPEVYALGDAAAVPDLSQPPGKDGQQPLCAPTAQHAMRQGSALARNVLADLRGEPRRAYRHRDLGLVVDLGGLDAVARPLGVSLNGPLAKVVTSGYHWYALPTGKRRGRLLSDWLLSGRTPDDVAFGLVSRGQAEAAQAEHE